MLVQELACQVVTLLLLSFSLSRGACVDQSLGCTCEEDDYEGYWSISCLNTSLTSIPSGLQLDNSSKSLKMEYNNLEVLDFVPYTKLHSLFLESNRIRLIKDGVFKKLIALQTLALRDNEISVITAETFTGLVNLDALYLERNPLHVLNPFTFVGDRLPALTILVLSQCDIYEIKDDAFHRLGDLKFLNLSSNHLRKIPKFSQENNCFQLNTVALEWNEITEIEGNQFSNLPALSKLLLSHNSISNLSESGFEGLETVLRTLYLGYNLLGPVLPNSLRRLEQLSELDLSFNQLREISNDSLPWSSLEKALINDNPWNCSCRNWWMRQMSVVKQYDYHSSIRCDSPINVFNESVFKVDSTTFDCPPSSPGRGSQLYSSAVLAAVAVGAIIGICLFIVFFALLRKRCSKMQISLRNMTNHSPKTTNSLASYKRVEIESEQAFNMAT